MDPKNKETDGKNRITFMNFLVTPTQKAGKPFLYIIDKTGAGLEDRNQVTEKPTPRISEQEKNDEAAIIESMMGLAQDISEAQSV